MEITLATDVRSRDCSANETLLAGGFCFFFHFHAVEKSEEATLARQKERHGNFMQSEEDERKTGINV